jgi:CRISPR-associated protein Cas1
MLDLSVGQMEAAWERVRENAGCAGVDGITVERYEHQAAIGLPELLARAQAGTYLPLPLRKVVVEKRPGTTHPAATDLESRAAQLREQRLDARPTRTLLVPAVRDRILQTAVARLLSRSWEEEFLDASYAYRPERGVDRAVARILQLRDRGWTFVLDADITGYFDHISHARMLDLLRAAQVAEEAQQLLQLWVRADVWDGRKVAPMRRGIAQGSPISPLLANYFLQPFDIALEESGNRLIRYADDFVVLCQSREQAEQAKPRVSELLKQSGLELNEEKTRITDFAAGFQFLGVQFRNREAMIPWKFKRRMGRVVFIARAMPSRLLREYRHGRAGKEPQLARVERAEPRVRPVDANRGSDDSAAREGSLAANASAAKTEEMAFLYITQQGAVVRKSGDRFLVEMDQQVMLDVPYHRLEQILIFGNVQVTTQAIAEALDKGVAISFFTHHGRFRGALQPPGGRNVTVRLKQYQLYEDRERSLAVARAIVRRKIENGLAVLKRYQDRTPQNDVTAAQRGLMNEMAAKAGEAPSLEELEGCEGAAAKSYFEGLMRFNRSELIWPGRAKHPATDPLNALLSLAYTLLVQEITALVEAEGLDPALGMLHEVDGNRPSLALDLVEPFRHPLADRFVMAEVNRSVFQSDDFEPGDRYGGLFLKSGAMRKFFEAFERFMLEGKVAFRQRLRDEVEKFGGFLRQGGEWSPFAFDAAGDGV